MADICAQISDFIYSRYFNFFFVNQNTKNILNVKLVQDGKISLDESLSYRLPIVNEQYTEYFAKEDKDGDGFINDEMREFFLFLYDKRPCHEDH